MMKKNAPYSGARRQANQKVAWNMEDVARGISNSFAGRPLTEKRKPTDTASSNSRSTGQQSASRQKANDAARMLGSSSAAGRTAVNTVRKARNRTADYLKSIGE